jgi:type IV secretory pathway VirD2 relaxase
VIKTRLVILKRASPRAVATHLRYIVREGTARGGGPPQPYDANADSADLRAFEARGRGDRHQFRFIIAPEDGIQLQDLRAFTRALIQQTERDLGTRLEWVAVDHWDTDNPHTHLVLRGKDQTGRDLVIARDYIAHGMRRSACELATEWLGPRTESELRANMQSQVGQERWTALDRALQAQSSDGLIDLSGAATRSHDAFRRSLLIGRLQRLSTMRLAEPQGRCRWRLRPDAEATLRAMGERGDIARTMQRAFAGEQRELAIFDAAGAASPVVGRIAAKGLLDELTDRAYIIIDGVDGRAHHAALAAGTDLAELPIGGIVEARGASERAVDRRIAALAEHGVYSTKVHLAELRGVPLAGRDPEAIVEAHVRRLEAFRRAGIVERMEEGLWRVPDDLPTRGRLYDRERLGASAVELLSHLPIEKQVRAIGATWLDQQLVDDARRLSDRGFGASAREALVDRKEFLVEQGLTSRRGERFILDRNFLITLRDREIDEAAKRVAAETGLVHRSLADSDRVAGVYRRSVLLASGRFAMIDDGLGFSLVPWRPVIEKRLGQNVAAILHGNDVSWQFGRNFARPL